MQKDIVNLYDLIGCYDVNRNAVYMTDIPEWLKKWYAYILGIIIFGFLYYCAQFEPGWTVFIIGGIIIFLPIRFLLKKESKYLLKKYDGKFGLDLKGRKTWVSYYTYHIQKSELQAILGNHVSNEALMTRLKTQLQGEISRNKKSIQTTIPVTGFVTVIIASYIGFNLRYFESSFKDDADKAYSNGSDFLFENGMMVAVILIFLILYKPIIEIWLNRYHSRLQELLSIIETIEIEYLATKTKSIEEEISNKTMD